MLPIAALIIVILNWPGTCRAMNSASTLVRRLLRYTLAVAAVITKSVSSVGGISPSGLRHVTEGVSIALIPPVDSRMPVIQFVRRASPSVNTPMPASRCRAMFSPAARSSTSRNPASVSLPCRCSARAASSQGCRSRLPTCSAWWSVATGVRFPRKCPPPTLAPVGVHVHGSRNKSRPAPLAPGNQAGASSVDHLDRAGRSRSLLPLLAVPPLHVLGVGAQVGAGLEEPVAEVEVQVVGLDVVHDEHGRHRPRELAERVEDVLRLRGDAGLERLVVDLGAAPHAGAVRPGAGGSGVERAAGTELALGEGLHGGGHVGVVRGTVGLEDPLAASGIRG